MTIIAERLIKKDTAAFFQKNRYYHCTPAFCSEWNGFTLSEGNIWIIAAGAVAILGGIAAIVINNKKKK